MSGERRLAYRLALAVGEPFPDRMLSYIPWRVWKEWVQYASQEPFGELRADLRIGTLSALFANAWLREKGRAPFEPRDFMPLLDDDPAPSREAPITNKASDPDSMLALIKVVNAEHGGKEVNLA